MLRPEPEPEPEPAPASPAVSPPRSSAGLATEPPPLSAPAAADPPYVCRHCAAPFWEAREGLASSARHDAGCPRVRAREPEQAERRERERLHRLQAALAAAERQLSRKDEDLSRKDAQIMRLTLQLQPEVRPGAGTVTGVGFEIADHTIDTRRRGSFGDPDDDTTTGLSRTYENVAEAAENAAVLAAAAALCEEGRTLDDIGNHLDAIAKYEKSRAKAREIPLPKTRVKWEGMIANNIGHAYSALAQRAHRLERRAPLLEAVKHYTQALTIAQETGNERAEGTRRGNLGVAHHNLGQYAKAVEHLTEALSIALSTGDFKRKEEVTFLQRVLKKAEAGKEAAAAQPH